MGKNEEVMDLVERLNKSIKRTATIWSDSCHCNNKGRTLKIISEHDGITSTELAELLNLSPSSMSERLGRLEESGDVKRTNDSIDRRVVHVYLTKSGEATLKEMCKGGKKGKDFTNVLTADEYKTYVELTNKLIKGLDDIYDEKKKKRIAYLKAQMELMALED